MEIKKTLNVSAIDKSIQIEDYLYEKFNCLLELRPSLPPEFQHSLFDSMIEGLKHKLINFHQNLQNIEISLNENKNKLSKTFEDICETSEHLKKSFKENQMKFMEKLIEEEVIRTKILKNNPSFISFIKTLSQMFDFNKTSSKSSETEGKETKINEENELKFFEESTENIKMNNEKEKLFHSCDETFQSNITQKLENCIDYQKRRNNDEVFFQKYIKPFKTIEEILRNFCPIVEKSIKGKKYLNYDFTEEDISRIKVENEKKFEKILSYIKLNKKFPDFEENSKLIEENGMYYLQFRILPEMQYLFTNVNFFYEMNLNYIENIPFKKNNRKWLKLYNSLTIHLDYQKEFLVLPYRANYFNKYSKLVFSHLENINKL